MSDFDSWWKRHWCKDIQATSKLENACRYAFNDGQATAAKRTQELESEIKHALRYMNEHGYPEFEECEPEFQMWRCLTSIVYPHGRDL